MATPYNPQQIQLFADKLYTRAASVVVGWILLGALGGGVAGFVAAAKFNSSLAGFLVFVLGIAIGYAIGDGKAFALRVQAQLLLCQLQTEINTRQAAQPAIVGTADPIAKAG